MNVRSASLPVRPARRALALIVSAAVALTGAVLAQTAIAAPAHAAETTYTDPTGATVVYDTEAVVGESIHLSGTGWLAKPDMVDEGEEGSVVGVKLIDGTVGQLNRTFELTNPRLGEPVANTTVWGTVWADSDGAFEIDLPWPDSLNATADPAWEAGDAFTLQLLSGTMYSDQPGVDPSERPDVSRTIPLTITVVDAAPAGTAPAIAEGAAPAGTVGTAYAFPVPGSGDPAPQYSVTAGALPAGLALDPVSGAISGAPTEAGDSAFTVQAANGIDPAATRDYTISIAAAAAPLAVAVQPQPVAAANGAQASFTVQASGGAAPVSVQWQRSTSASAATPPANYTNLSATNTVDGSFVSETLVITVGSNTNVNNRWYRAVFTDADGSTVTTDAVKLSVVPAPTVTTHPAGQTISEGGTATFTAAGTSTVEMTIAWQSTTTALPNGEPDDATWAAVAGADSATLTVEGIDADAQHGTFYRAAFTNVSGTAYSYPAQLRFTEKLDTEALVTVSGESYGPVQPNNPFSVSAPNAVVQGSTIVITGTGYLATDGATGSVANFMIDASYSGDPNTLSTTREVINPVTGTVFSDKRSHGIVQAGADGTWRIELPWPDETNTTRDADFFATNWAPGTQHIVRILTGSLLMSPADYQRGITVRFTVVDEATTPPAVAPEVTTQPADSSVAAGGTATFAAAASGDPAPTVQWQSKAPDGDWTDVPGATGAELAVTGTTVAQSGTQYRAVFANAAGSATSAAATLTVTAAAVAPAITTQPAHVTAEAGQDATFTAAAEGTPAPTVQWESSTDVGATWTPIAGATSATLTLAGVTEAQIGTRYRAVFANAGGTTATNAAVLTVLPVSDPAYTYTVAMSNGVPAGVLVTPKEVAVGEPITVSGIGFGTKTAAGGSGGPVFLNQPSGGTGPVSVANRTVENQIPGSTFADLRAHGIFFSDAAGSWSITFPFPTPDNSTLTAETAWQAGQTQTFRILTGSLVENDWPRSVAASFDIVVGGQPPADPPVITEQPQGADLFAGQFLGLHVAATSESALSYQWERSADGSAGTWDAIPGETGEWYFATVTAADDGFYRVVVSDAAGLTVSDAVRVVVREVEPGAAPLFYGQPEDVETSSAKIEVNLMAYVASESMPTVRWEALLPGESEWETVVSGVRVDPGAMDPGAGLWAVGFGIYGWDGRDYLRFAVDGAQFRAVAVNESGETASAPATLTVLDGPSVTLGADTVHPGGTLSFTGSGFTPGEALTARLDVRGTGITGVLDPTAPIVVAEDGTMSATVAIPLSFTTDWSEGAPWGDAAFLLLQGASTAVQSEAVAVEGDPAGTLPVFTTQPASASIVAGERPSFTVVVSPADGVEVYWQGNSGGSELNWSAPTRAEVDEDGAATWDLAFSPGNGYRVRFVAFTSAGTVTSDVATVTVVPGAAPAVTTHPLSTTVEPGATATFTVAATGTPTPSVQWESSADGAAWTPIAGATGTTLTLADVTLEDSGTRYRAVLTNAVGTATSNPATLTVSEDTEPGGGVTHPGVSDPSVTFTTPAQVVEGADITVSGTGWTVTDGSRGSVVAIKLDDGGVSTTRDVTNPENGLVQGNKTIWAIVSADEEGAFTLTFPFPTADNASTDLSGWTVGSTHSIRFLTGSLVSGDKPRTEAAAFTIVSGDEPQPSGAIAVTSTTVEQYGDVWFALSEFEPGAAVSIELADGAGEMVASKPFTIGTDGNTADPDGQTYRKVTVPRDAAPASDYVLRVRDTGSGEIVATSEPITVTAATTRVFNPGDHASGEEDLLVQRGGTWTFHAVGFAPGGTLVATAEVGGETVVLGGLGQVSAEERAWQLDGNGDTLREPVFTRVQIPASVLPGEFAVTFSDGEKSVTRTLTIEVPATAEVTVEPTAELGGTIRVTGAGFTHPTEGGSRIAIKIDEGAYSRVDSSLHANRTIWWIVDADENGSFEIDLPLPNGTAADDAAAGTLGSVPALAAGGSHTLRFLTGSLNGGPSRTVQSAPFTVTAPGGAEEGPVVTTQPADVTVAAGGDAGFTAAASGSPAPTVQWESSADGTTWTPLAGATSATLALSDVAAEQSGTRYRAVFTNAAGTATSSAATLTVTAAPAAPVVTLQPTELLLTGEETSVVTIQVCATGAESATWEWLQPGEADWSAVPVSDSAQGRYNAIFTPDAWAGPCAGADDASLHMRTVRDGIEFPSGTSFRVVFAGAGGTTATSEPIVVTVDLDHTEAPAFAGDPVDSTVEEGRGALFGVPGVSGVPAPTVTWEVSTDGGATWQPFTGTVFAPGLLIAIDPVTLEMSGNRYRAVAENEAGVVRSNPAVLTVSPRTVAPTVSAQPADVSAVTGTDAAFTVGVAGSPVPSVQWEASADGATWTPVPGATGATLTLPAVTEAQSGTRYRAVLANAAGTATSEAATLTVTAAPVEENPKPDYIPFAPVTDGDDLPGDLEGGVTIVQNGSNVVVTVPGAEEGEWFFVYGYSDPVGLGWHQADANASFVVDLTPLGAGEHRLAVLDADGVLVGWATVVLAAGPGTSALTGTGREATAALPVLALLVILSGAVLAIGARRRAHR